MAPRVHKVKVTYVHMAVAAKVRQAKSSIMATPPASPTTTTPASRKPLSLLLLSLSLPVLLLLLSVVFILSHTTFSLLICPLLPRPPSRRNASTSGSSNSYGVSMDKTLQAFHASTPPTSRRNATNTSSSRASLGASMDNTAQAFHVAAPPPPPLPAAPVKTSNSKKASAKRNKSLVKLLLRSTPQTRRFAARADELFAAPCTDRFFMTWLSPLAQFGCRELLVLESLFRWHRGACLLVASDTMDSAGGRDRLRSFLDRGFRVAVASPDFAYLLNGTPAEAWLGAVQRGGVSPGSVPLGQNLSNLLRLALLYRYGGVYIDADIVVLRPFSGLRNAIGAQAVDEATGGWRRLNNAVMVFDRAHPLLREFIAEFAAAFDGNKWGHNGPYLVSRVAARLRQRPGFDVTVLPPRAFYPVHWSKIGGLFVAPKDRKGERWVKAKMENIKGESFGIHLWNRESRRLQMEEGSVIGRLISDSCLFCNSSMFVKQG
ncbi:hypothetical protein BAE44_0003545 [Dichanthelium oligosanthes]|uniref:Alpha 1,4-glycosyltransferase domain-containing protein n=1 Tax=Dichanthelium oligosanthes TaxID=888268 RepID=A0A1E5WDT1_9POAL|nr:hypothetical protein BAE44_0003545 [Dichanthelium oligosanthes]